MREEFQMPNEVIVDEATGLALNIPAEYQEWPNWWNDDPVKYAALQSARATLGISINDFPSGTSRMEGVRKWKPMEVD